MYVVKIRSFGTVLLIVTVVDDVSEKDVSDISIFIVLGKNNEKEQDRWASRQPFLGGDDIVLFHYPTKGQGKRKICDDVDTS